jgi:hypothetical protein
MKPVRIVSGVKRSDRLVDSSPLGERLDPAVIEQGLDARPVSSSAGLDLFGVLEAMRRMLHSSGGRPSLVGAESQAKIPRMADDWAKLERLAGGLDGWKHRPSPGQIAAVILHLALNRIPESELEEAARKEFA